MPRRELGKYHLRRLQETFCWVALGITLLVIVFMAYAFFQERSVVKPVPRVSVERKSEPPRSKPKRVKEPIKIIGEIKVIVDGLNLRSSPEKAPGNVIGVLRKGRGLKVVSKSDGWYEVVTPDGKRGYVSAHPRYVRILKMKR
ncbi:MAG: SH3 domain-containing protein [Actinomycetota bacterium]